VAKVRINGEVFSWDTSRKPMSEALALEAALKCRYADWESDMQAGSARALCGFIWLVWRRNGRDVPIGDILSGEVEIDLDDLAIEREEGEEDPTSPSPAASSTTAASTSAPSPSGSGSGRGSSPGSARANVKR
jgi:hypothetical protein